MGQRSLSIVVAAATAAVIIVNVMATTGSINGIETGAVSDKYPTLITPAGYAFSIWSIIYLGLIVFSVIQLFRGQLDRYARIRGLYILTCILNIAWIVFWHYEMMGVCLALILGLAITLLVMIGRLKDMSGAGSLLWSRATFGLYAGWVTAASFVNFVIFLVAQGTVPAGAEGGRTVWFSAVLLLAAAAVGVLVRVKLANYLYPLAIAWALTAIAVKQSGNTIIVIAAALGVVACLVSALSFVVNLPDSENRIP